MEEEQRKNKSQHINTSNHGGGAITGLIVFGGAMAITGLMAIAALATDKKNKKKGSQLPQQTDCSGCKNEGEEVESSQDQDQGQGMRSRLCEDEDSTTTDANACCATCVTPEITMNQINSTDLLSTQTLILEEKPDLKTSNGESTICSFPEEIVFSDDFHPGSAVLLSDDGVEENMDKTESDESHKFIEMVEAQSENGTTETETHDDIDDDEEFDGSVGSSEATARTSMDSNEEPIWPAELIVESHEELKEKILDLKSPQEELEKAVATPKTDHSESDSSLSTEVDTDSSKSESSDCVGDYDYGDMTRETKFIDKTNLYAALNDHDQPSVRVSHPSNLRIWIAPLLLLTLLLLVLLVFTGSTPLSSFFLHGTSAVDP